MLLMYQNSSQLSSFDTLILKRVLILHRSLVVPEKEEKKEEYQKGTFLRQPNRRFVYFRGGGAVLTGYEEAPRIGSR
jgi:hypothetical protein